MSGVKAIEVRELKKRHFYLSVKLSEPRLKAQANAPIIDSTIPLDTHFVRKLLFRHELHL